MKVSLCEPVSWLPSTFPSKIGVVQVGAGLGSTAPDATTWYFEYHVALV